MKSECIEAVSLAVGRSLTNEEIKGIETRINRNMRQLATADREAWQQLSQAERLTNAAQSAAEEIIQEAEKRRQRVALTIAAHDRVSRFLDDRMATGVDAIDAFSRMLAFHADTKGNTMSVETTAKAIERDALRQMLETLEQGAARLKDDPSNWAKHFFGLLENKEGTQAVVRELFGEESGVAGAREGAKQFHQVAAALRERFNRAGGDVGQLEDWGMPHHHSRAKVAKAGREQWAGDVMPYLNRSKYTNPDGTPMNSQELMEFLGFAWESIATDGVNKLNPGQFRGAGMRANRGNQARQIHFKDAESYLQYQAKYGERTLYEVMVGHISSVAKDVALVEALGPNPDHQFRLWKDKLRQDLTLANPDKAGKLQQRLISLENLYDLVTGKHQPVANEHLAKTFDTLRNWLVASRLGGAVITSLSDEGTMHLVAAMNKLPKMRMLANELRALNPRNQMEKRLALRAGLAMNTYIASLNRFGQEGLGASFSSKMAQTVLRASGLNALTEARRRAFGVTMMSSIGQLSRDARTLGELDPGDYRILLSKGITDTDWEVWRRATPESWNAGNPNVLTPGAIYRIPDDSLTDLGDPAVLRENAATRLLGAVLEESDVAVIEPGAKERAMMMANIQRGTWKGELARSFFLFKSFPISMIERHWMRGMDSPTAGGRARYLAMLIASTTLLGVVSMQIKEVVKGRDPLSMNPEADGGMRNWMRAMLMGGSLGLYGDFVFSESTQYGNTPIGAMMGPVVGLAESSLNLTQGNLIQALMGKDTHAGAEALRFVKGNLPGANLWYTKAAFDHMIYHELQEFLSPGYLAQMRRRAAREFKQSYWWEPGETLPDRAPDLSRVVAE
ncbi:MAG: hypothetical protein CML06_21015 [Pseudomonadales bacterium]|nr:hypothetical protein [Pseudomonadales bacterium]